MLGTQALFLAQEPRSFRVTGRVLKGRRAHDVGELLAGRLRRLFTVGFPRLPPPLGPQRLEFYACLLLRCVEMETLYELLLIDALRLSLEAPELEIVLIVLLGLLEKAQPFGVRAMQGSVLKALVCLPEPTAVLQQVARQGR